MDALLLDIWGCAKCKRHETPVVKDFGEAGQSTVCPSCGSEDIFPLNDGGWRKDTMEREPSCRCDELTKTWRPEDRAALCGHLRECPRAEK